MDIGQFIRFPIQCGMRARSLARTKATAFGAVHRGFKSLRARVASCAQRDRSPNHGYQLEAVGTRSPRPVKCEDSLSAPRRGVLLLIHFWVRFETFNILSRLRSLVRGRRALAGPQPQRSTNKVRSSVTGARLADGHFSNSAAGRRDWCSVAHTCTTPWSPFPRGGCRGTIGTRCRGQRHALAPITIFKRVAFVDRITGL